RGAWALGEADALRLVFGAAGEDQRPAGQLEDVAAELLLADLAVLESAMEGARKRARGGRSPSAEVEALERAREALARETPLRDAGLSEEDRGHLRAMAPLTLKPVVVVANLEEGLEV